MGIKTFLEKPLNKFSTGLIFGITITAIFLYFFYIKDNINQKFYPLRLSDLNTEENYRLIDPLLGIKRVDDYINPEFEDLEEEVNSIIENYKNNGKIKTASVSFRDAKKSGGFIINSKEEYSPASLMKVPTMIAYFKMAENDKNILKTKLTDTDKNDYNSTQSFPPTKKIEKYKPYTIEEIIGSSIENSDNNAAQLLVKNLNDTNKESSLVDLFEDLGLTEIDLSDDFITIQGYSLFFRVLYNSTYLNREMSEKALEILTKTNYNFGIRSVVPKDITVAEKFGEFSLQYDNGSVKIKELHNCGFVYYPKHTYLLCIMTKGNDFDSLKNIIKEISSAVYQFVDKNSK
jgi:beta-lactamase class A